jgi:hypothetical protein
MTTKLLLALALLLPGMALADEDQFPSRRPGLWEGTVKTGGAPRPSKSCVSPASDRKMLEFGAEQLKKMGGQITTSVEGKTIHLTTVATLAGRSMKAEETIVLTGDTLMTGTGHTSFNPPLPGMGRSMDRDTEMESHWVGPCPADMQPGDVIADGKKFNVLQLSAD